MARNSDYNKVVSFRLDLRDATQRAIYEMLLDWKVEDGSIRPRMIAVLTPYATGGEAVKSTRLEDRIMQMLREFLSSMEDLLDQSQEY